MGSRIFRCAARPDRGKTQLCIDYFDRPLRAQVFPARPGDEVSNTLRGYDPRTIMTAAFNGINWWCEQAFLVQKLTTRQVASEGDAAAQGYKNKLLEVHSAYKRAKAKAEALWQQMQQLELDKKELQSKYEQKSGEKRRIEASFRELQSRAVAGAGAPAPSLPRAHSHAVAMPPPSRHGQPTAATGGGAFGAPAAQSRPGGRPFAAGVQVNPGVFGGVLSVPAVDPDDPAVFVITSGAEDHAEFMDMLVFRVARFKRKETEKLVAKGTKVVVFNVDNKSLTGPFEAARKPWLDNNFDRPVQVAVTRPSPPRSPVVVHEFARGCNFGLAVPKTRRVIWKALRDAGWIGCVGVETRTRDDTRDDT